MKTVLAFLAGSMITVGAVAIAAQAYVAVSTYQLLVTDTSGNLYVAGEGSDCGAAWENAQVPQNWREITCKRVAH